VLRLPYEDALLFIGGLPPYRGRKIMYYLDARLAPRAALPAPESARAQRRELLTGARSEWEALGPVMSTAAAPAGAPTAPGGFVPPVPALAPEGAAGRGAAPPPSLSSAWEQLFGEAPPAAQEGPDPEAVRAEPGEEPPAPKPGGGLPL
jgi:hypothetical protein